MKKNLLALIAVVFGMSAMAQSPRMSLYEEFTGETCPPCAAVNPGLNAILLSSTNASKIIAIKWQVPIPFAPTNTWSLYQTNKTEIDWRYRSPAAGGYGYASLTGTSSNSLGVNSAPQCRIDGQHQTTFGAASDYPGQTNNTIISNAQSVPSPFTISMQRAWNYNCSAVTLTITVTASQNFNATGNLVFRTVMVERLINFSVQPGTNGEKKFEDVAIKSFPTLQNGTPMASSWTTNQSMTFTLNCPLPSYTRKKEEVAFVGFIQDDGTKMVHQAARADKAPLPPDALTTVAAKVNITCSSQITPELTVFNAGTNPITSINVVPYINNVAGSQITWNGNIPANTTSNITLPALAAPSTPGVHTFSYNVVSLNAPVFNIAGNSTKVSFMVVGPYQATPVAEGFVLGAYPPAGWAYVNPDQGQGWSRTTLTGGYFQNPMQASKYDFFSNPNIGDMDELILPPVDLSGTSDPDMSFDYAYAQRTGAENDQLEVQVSDDCGQTWTAVWTKAGGNLSTAAPMLSAYLPDPNEFTQWTTAMFTLPGYNKNSILVKFVTTNDGGNNLYIDNVNLVQKSPGIPTGLTAGSAAMNVNVYPNPSNGVANINISAITTADVKISVINALGQVVFTKATTVHQGSNAVSVDVKEFAAGIYNVVIDTNSGSTVKKLTVTK